MASKTVSVRLTSETLEKLGAMAEAMHRPRAWLMAHAIERYIEQEAWQVAVIQTAVDELDKGQGDLVEHAAVVQWLERWEAESEAAPPSCCPPPSRGRESARPGAPNDYLTDVLASLPS